MDDLISRKAAIDAILAVTGNSSVRELYEHVQEHGLSDMWSGGVNAAIDIIIAVPSAQTEHDDEVTFWKERANEYEAKICEFMTKITKGMAVDSIVINEDGIVFKGSQIDIIHCRDCKYGEQDEIGRWYCRGLGCQMGDDEGNGFCSDAEKREE